MANDKRKKGCPSPECVMNAQKVMQKADNDYCPKCGSRLVFVCEKCFTEIEDIDSKHRICSLCEAKKEEKVQKAKDKAKNGVAKAGKAVAGIVVPVAIGVVGKVVKDGQKGAINKGVEVIEGLVERIVKK